MDNGADAVYLGFLLPPMLGPFPDRTFHPRISSRVEELPGSGVDLLRPYRKAEGLGQVMRHFESTLAAQPMERLEGAMEDFWLGRPAIEACSDE